MSYIMFGIKRSLIFVVLIISSMNVSSQNEKKAKLVVGIVLENFSVDYLSKYYSSYSEGGFKRLMTEGAYFENASYPYFYSQTGVDHASIYTGCTPSVHGVIAHSWYNRLLHKTFEGISSNSSYASREDKYNDYSPDRLLLTTLGDELKKSSVCSRVFGVSMNAESSMIASGHMADAAFWFNHERGEWCSSSFYLDSLHNWTREYNKNLSLDYYVKRGWRSLSYDNPQYKNAYGLSKSFFHDMEKIRKSAGNYRVIKASPYANVLVNEFAKNLIVNENLGKDNDVDFLNISYSFLDYECDKYESSAVEKIDMLYRLDKQLADMLNFLDDQVGKGEYIIALTVSQAMMPLPSELNEHKLPGGYFNSYKAVSLLKSYLNIKYEPADWISSYDSQQIYLNRVLIAKNNLDLKEIQDVVVDFLIQFSGVYKAVPAYLLSYGQFCEGIDRMMYNSFSHKRSGDVMYCLEPGWMNSINDREDSFAKYSSIRRVPLIFYGSNIIHKVVKDEVSILDIMPSLSVKMGLSIPNSCMGRIIVF